MVAAAREGVDVVRLKSGDPAIFGRLGEELDALRTAAVEFEIVPGITAGVAAAASLGMSLTDRRSASRLLIASAQHASDTKGEIGPARSVRGKSDWSGLAREDTTLIIYMPGHGIASLREELLASGVPADTPAIIVSNASTPRQRHFHTTLGEIHLLPAMEAPSVLLIGRALGCAGQGTRASDGVSHLIHRAEALFSTR